MLANLVENAIRHTPPQSVLALSLRQAASGPAGAMTDDGPGIPAAARDKVFRRFFHVETSRTTAGNGLGLSLVAAVAELHDIRIELLDMDPGLSIVLQFPSGAALRLPALA